MRHFVSFRFAAAVVIAVLAGSADAVADAPVNGPAPVAPSPRGASSSARPPGGGHKVVILGEEFTLRQARDPRNRGQVVETFLAPQTWADSSQVGWDLSSPNNPAYFSIKVSNPANDEEYNLYRDAHFYSLRPDDRSVPMGRAFMGAVHLYPMAPARALVAFASYLRGRQPKFQVIGSRDLPKLPGAELYAANVHPHGVGVKVSYELNGKPVEEEFYAVHYLIDLPYDGPMGRTWETHWGLYLPRSFRAAAGTLNQRRPIFAAIYHSSRLNQTWNRRLEAVSKALQAEFSRGIQAANDRTAAARRYSEQITANSNAFLANVERQNQALYADSSSSPSSSESGGRDPAEKTDDYLRGVTTLDDPLYGTQQLSNGYEYHWTDGNGSYRSSNDGTYDPNATENSGSWQLMKPSE